MISLARVETAAQVGDCLVRVGEPAAPIAAAARDLKHRDLAGNIAELNRAVLHRHTNASSPRPMRYTFVPISTSA